MDGSRIIRQDSQPQFEVGEQPGTWLFRLRIFFELGKGFDFCAELRRVTLSRIKPRQVLVQTDRRSATWHEPVEQLFGLLEFSHRGEMTRRGNRRPVRIVEDRKSTRLNSSH